MTRLLLTLALLAGTSAIASAQEPALSGLPAACRPAAGMDGMAGMDHGTGGGDTMSGMDGMTEDHQRESMASMRVMDSDMTIAHRIKDADLSFACGMIAHHQGAIAMSEIELKHGKDDAMKQLAETIIAAQKAEIAEMTDWVFRNAGQ